MSSSFQPRFPTLEAILAIREMPLQAMTFLQSIRVWPLLGRTHISAT